MIPVLANVMLKFSLEPHLLLIRDTVLPPGLSRMNSKSPVALCCPMRIAATDSMVPFNPYEMQKSIHIKFGSFFFEIHERQINHTMNMVEVTVAKSARVKGTSEAKNSSQW